MPDVMLLKQSWYCYFPSDGIVTISVDKRKPTSLGPIDEWSLLETIDYKECHECVRVIVRRLK